MSRLLLAFFLVFTSMQLKAEPKPVVLAIVAQDQTPLRAAPKAASPLQASLWQGEALEIRGERLDYLQVYDYRRERGGYVRAGALRRVVLDPEHAPELLSVVRFLRGTPGSEALGLAFAAAYVQAAPSDALKGPDGIETLDAIGTMADRLARRASSDAARGAAGKTISAHLEVASHHGVRFAGNERDGRVHVCYEGDAFRRVLQMRSEPAQRARAALGLTRAECMPGDLQPAERRRMDEWRVEVLDQVDVAPLAAWERNRVLLRRAAVWSALAYQRARTGEQDGAPAQAAASRALDALSRVSKAELAEDDLPAYADAAMRVNASRWALQPAPTQGPSAPSGRPSLLTVAGAPGETCLLLVDGKNGAQQPLARRCTYGLVWAGSATLNREGNALAVAVQPTEAWRELWVFRKAGSTWTVRVLPPASTNPEVGYAEFAGWVPGGAQLLVAREAAGEGRYRRNFELVRLDTLGTVRQVPDPSMLGAFQRWQDAAWKRQTLALR